MTQATPVVDIINEQTTLPSEQQQFERLSLVHCWISGDEERPRTTEHQRSFQLAQSKLHQILDRHRVDYSVHGERGIPL